MHVLAKCDGLVTESDCLVAEADRIVAESDCDPYRQPHISNQTNDSADASATLQQLRDSATKCPIQQPNCASQ